jgi:hypothetical protein
LDSFSSFESANPTGLGSNRLIAGVGEFSNPAMYLNNQLRESGIQKEDPLLSALQDPHLSIGAELSNASTILSNFGSSAAARAMGIVIEERAATETKAQSFKAPLADANAAMGIVIEERAATEAKAQSFKAPWADANAAMGIVIEERAATKAKAQSFKAPLADANAAMGIVIEERAATKAKAQSFKAPLADANAAMGIVIEERNLTTFTNMSESVRKAANLYQTANLSMLSKNVK